MSIESPPTSRPPRLNPFLFPPDTDFRFTLLIASVVGASLFIYETIYNGFTSLDPARFSLQLECVKAGSLDPAASPGGLSEWSTALGVALEAEEDCLEPFRQAESAWLASGVILLLLVAILIYWLLPPWKIWRGKLTLLKVENAPEVVAYLAGLCGEAGLRRPPVFLWNPLNPVISGLAFGRLGRYYAALSGGLVTRFYTDRPAFRAILLHELAHLRNADVDKTYFAVAIWQAFVVAALAPLIAVQPYFLIFALDFSWRAIALVALVYLTRNAVLRARELYADLQASKWDEPTGSLGRVLETLPQPKIGRWQAPLQVHPHPVERRQTVADTRRLFPMSFWEVFSTGVAVTVGFGSVNTFLGIVIKSTPLREFIISPVSFLITALIFAPLAVGVVGAGVWRMTFAALWQGRALGGAGRLGVSLGLGLLVGQMLSFESSMGLLLFAEENDLTAYLAFFLVSALWGMVLLASLFLFFRWITAGAWLWLETANSSRALRRAYGIGQIVTGGLLTLWLGLLLLVYDAAVHLSSILVDIPLSGFEIALGGLAFAFLAVAYLALQPLTALLFVGLWAFPLAAWFRRQQIAKAQDMSWAFFDPLPQTPALPQQPPLRPGLALAVGLVSGFAFCGLLLIIRIVLRLSLSEAVRDSDQYKLALYYGQVAMATLMQAGAAAIVAGWAKRLGILHGLFAAFTAGGVMAAGVLSINLLFGGSISVDIIWITFSQVINWGAFLSLPLAVCVAAAMGWLRQLRPIK